MGTSLLDNPAVHNLIVWPNVAQRPSGDLVQFDIADEAANSVISQLRGLRLERVGSITIERIETALSDIAARSEVEAPGDPSEAVIWEEVEARIRDDSGLSTSFVLLLTIAATGILTDSSVLIVGAMVVGPEYGPLTSIALGLHKQQSARLKRGLRVLAGIAGSTVALTEAKAGALIGVLVAVRGWSVLAPPTRHYRI